MEVASDASSIFLADGPIRTRSPINRVGTLPLPVMARIHSAAASSALMSKSVQARPLVLQAAPGAGTVRAEAHSGEHRGTVSDGCLHR